MATLLDSAVYGFRAEKPCFLCSSEKFREISPKVCGIRLALPLASLSCSLNPEPPLKICFTKTERSGRRQKLHKERVEVDQVQSSQSPPVVHFDAYWLDYANEQLWRGKQLVRLTGKSFAALCYLIDHAGQLVRKDDLFLGVWSGTIVSDSTLTSCIKELRKALMDDAKTPRYIETIHRRGYRFIASLSSSSKDHRPQADRNQSQEAAPHSSLPATSSSPPTDFVGRDAELRQLHSLLARAVQGERQMVFVTGEPGIGKTTVIETFLKSLETREWRLGLSPGVSGFQPSVSRFWLGRGQCIEHYGAGEAYMPVLEALSRLCQEKEGGQLTALLHRYAPTWLVQMPALLHDAELEAPQRKTQGGGRERMLREMAEAIAVLTVQQPLVLVLEDLHWSDYSTLELLGALMRRREPARLLVIGAYRPADLTMSENPLKRIKQELQLHQHCRELHLPPLKKEEVATYLSLRFPGLQLAETLGPLLHQRTDGNPLFMVNIVDSLVTQGMLVQQGGRWRLIDGFREESICTPETVRQMIEQQIEQLTVEEQTVLEAASVVGAEFSTAAVAAAIAKEERWVEERCEKLARRGQFLRGLGVGEWPDGTLAARYGFTHVLYRSVIYDRLSELQCLRFHRRIGVWEETAYGNRVEERAAELAVHFERGREYRRALCYLRHAGDTASARSAPQEAIRHLTKALELLKTLPETPERAQQELGLLVALTVPLIAVKGYAAADVEAVCQRAHTLCQQLGDLPQLFPVLGGLQAIYHNRAEFPTAFALAEQMLRLAQRQQEPILLLWAHYALGFTLARQGELVAARTHLEQSLAFYEPHKPGGYGYVQDPGATGLMLLAHVLSLLGYPDQAREKSQAALALARELVHPYTLTLVLGLAAELHGRHGERWEAQELAEEAIVLAREHGFSLRVAVHTFYQGWLRVMCGETDTGLAQMRQELLTLQSMGAQRGWRLVRLVEAYGQAERSEEGFHLVSKALTAVSETGERCEEGELYRLKGELLVQAAHAAHSRNAIPGLSRIVVEPTGAVTKSACRKNLRVQTHVSL